MAATVDSAATPPGRALGDLRHVPSTEPRQSYWKPMRPSSIRAVVFPVRISDPALGRRTLPWTDRPLSAMEQHGVIEQESREQTPLRRPRVAHARCSFASGRGRRPIRPRSGAAVQLAA